MPVDFQAEVLERSHEVPVVVDFWAPWCAPCRMLGPAIESLAEAAGGRWELVKLDTDEQPDVAQAWGVRGIPAVKMFLDGKVTGEFVGALSKEEVHDWLQRHLPDARSNRLGALAARWPAEGGAAVRDELEAVVRENPDFARGKLYLALALVGEDPARVRVLLAESGGDGDDAELAADVTALADLAELGDDVPPRLAPDLTGAREALRTHDLDAALQHLVNAAMRDRRFSEELARRAAVALFRLLGSEHDLVDKYQRPLAMAIHS